ncbi:MAG TPA: dihydrolipoamide acetyltransferase family protein [Acidimicrobiia bacterium]|nr:dihydrolipoamide acetyltransferase family protein [Acidimicrobiia bacterium]
MGEARGASPPLGPAPEPPSAPVPPSRTGPGPSGGDAPLASPIVRRLAAQRGLDLQTIVGTGDGGRVTRNDVLGAAPAAGTEQPVATPTAPPASAHPDAPGGPVAEAKPERDRVDEVIPFDNMRRRTAEHMVRSKVTSAHVYTSVEVDFDRIDQARRSVGAEWKAREGFSLTYLPFIVRAFCDAVDDFPLVNASVDGEALAVHRAVNVGIAVDLDYQGLIAPVIRDADGKRLRLIAREIQDLAGRARSKHLGPDDVIGGTFTITNMGPFGTLMTLPIINQPQVAILATDAVRKKPVVIEAADGGDAIAIHPVGVLALTWDHRAFDGAYAAGFLHALRESLETRDWATVLS